VYRYLKPYTASAAILFFSLVCIGQFIHYSPVPFWDMWGPYVDFYAKLQGWQLSEWFAQYNEHRIVLSRILFFIDNHLFNGRFYFLLLINVLLLGGMGLIFRCYITRLFTRDKATAWILFMLTLVMVFSWLQENNITWGFQSQFILAYLLPLTTFFCLARSAESGKGPGYLTGAIVLGILSSVTMANGVLALPLACCMILACRMGWFKFVLAAAAAALVIYLYFRNYSPVGGHGSLMETLARHPGQFFLYLITYLGSPFYHVLWFDSLVIAQAAGFTMILASLWAAKTVFMDMGAPPVLSGLIAFIAYIGGTAFATAGGRAVFGIKQAVESRYLTPALAGWTALMIVYAYRHRKKILVSKPFAYTAVLIPLLLLPPQLDALKRPHHTLAARRIGFLAVELNIRDEAYTKQIFPFTDWLFDIAVIPRQKNMTLFGDPMFRDMADHFGTPALVKDNAPLRGNIETVRAIDGPYAGLRGWVFNPETKKVPAFLWVADKEMKIIGAAISGLDRPDVKHSVHANARFSGFEGYVQKGAAKGDLLYLIQRRTGSSLAIPMPGPAPH